MHPDNPIPDADLLDAVDTEHKDQLDEAYRAFTGEEPPEGSIEDFLREVNDASSSD